MTVTALDKVKVDGRTLAFREAGEGPAVLLLHGWPTSSFLWRNVMPAIARERRVLALDLPGFGASDKPTDVTYGFDFFTGAVGGFLDALEIDDVAARASTTSAGPSACGCALDHPDRVRAVALTNTLLYPEDIDRDADAVRRGASDPGRARAASTSPEGLEAALRLGTNGESSVTDETIAGMVEPFASDEDRLALAKAGGGARGRGHCRDPRRAARPAHAGARGLRRPKTASSSRHRRHRASGSSATSRRRR